MTHYDQVAADTFLQNAPSELIIRNGLSSYVPYEFINWAMFCPWERRYKFKHILKSVKVVFGHI